MFTNGSLRFVPATELPATVSSKGMHAVYSGEKKKKSHKV